MHNVMKMLDLGKQIYQRRFNSTYIIALAVLKVV